MARFRGEFVAVFSSKVLTIRSGARNDHAVHRFLKPEQYDPQRRQSSVSHKLPNVSAGHETSVVPMSACTVGHWLLAVVTWSLVVPVRKYLGMVHGRSA